MSVILFFIINLHMPPLYKWTRFVNKIFIQLILMGYSDFLLYIVFKLHIIFIFIIFIVVSGWYFR